MKTKLEIENNVTLLERVTAENGIGIEYRMPKSCTETMVDVISEIGLFELLECYGYRQTLWN